MSLLTQFKLVKQYSNKYFDILDKQLCLDKVKTDADKERIGFYILILEYFCGIRDLGDQLECITDTMFWELVEGSKDDDLGIDAVFVDEENSIINLFNFKYRQDFKPNRNQEANSTYVSGKFFNFLDSGSTDGLNGRIKDKLEKIFECINQPKGWDFVLNIVSNEPKELSIDAPSLKQYEDHYGLKVVPIALPTIKTLMSSRPRPLSASFILERRALMTYEEDDLSSSKSYIVKLKSSELIRITCDKQEVRNNPEDTILPSLSLNFDVLFDNVRGFIQRSKFNQNIYETITNEPNKLFMYNNGITILAKNIHVTEKSAKQKYLITLDDFQVVNGGQTLRTLHDFNQQLGNVKKANLEESEILVRIFNISESDSNVTNKIAEYTNSQNSISNTDLKSLSSEQLELEKFLASEGIQYSRRRGDLGVYDYDYTTRISSERYGQVLIAWKGYPEKSLNQKKDIFGKFYKSLFIENFRIEESPFLVKKYDEVIAYYKSVSNHIKPLDIKYYYVIFIIGSYKNQSIESALKALEHAIQTYDSESEKTIPRRMIQLGFKDHLISQLGQPDTKPLKL